MPAMQQHEIDRIRRALEAIGISVTVLPQPESPKQLAHAAYATSQREELPV